MNRLAAKRLIPRVIRDALRRVRRSQEFSGRFSDWGAARATCTGYDSDVILARVLASTLAVVEGKAAYERDGVLFHDPSYEPGLLAALLSVAGHHGGRLRVIDFGGALGTTYWRHRRAFDHLEEVVWDVVEQPAFVAAGRAHLGATPLRFFASVEDAQAFRGHEVLLVSTALQYLEAPGAWIDRWLAQGWPTIIFNNLPLIDGAPDRIAVQKVPKSIYPASYPVWFLNRQAFLGRFEADYGLEAEFASEAVWQVGWDDLASTGLIFNRRTRR